MNPFLPDEVDALRALVRTWPNTKMVVLGAAGLRCSMPISWRTTEDLDLSVAALRRSSEWTQLCSAKRTQTRIRACARNVRAFTGVALTEGYPKLDTVGPLKGEPNARWKLRVNVGLDPERWMY